MIYGFLITRKIYVKGNTFNISYLNRPAVDVNRQHLDVNRRKITDNSVVDKFVNLLDSKPVLGFWKKR